VVECSEEEYPAPKSVVGVVGRPGAGLLWDRIWMFTLSSELGRTCSNGDWPARLGQNSHMTIVITPVQLHYSLIANVKEKEMKECNIIAIQDLTSSYS
jgi:hypothetical protein